MWRTNPSSDIVEGSTERRARSAASSPAHFSCSVSRCQRRCARSVARSSPMEGPSSRGSLSGSMNMSALLLGLAMPTTIGDPFDIHHRLAVAPLSDERRLAASTGDFEPATDARRPPPNRSGGGPLVRPCNQSGLGDRDVEDGLLVALQMERGRDGPGRTDVEAVLRRNGRTEGRATVGDSLI